MLPPFCTATSGPALVGMKVSLYSLDIILQDFTSFFGVLVTSISHVAYLIMVSHGIDD